MSLADKLNALIAAKAAMRTAIVNKGVTVETTEPLSGYAAKISEIPAGGGTNVTAPIIAVATLLEIGQDIPIDTDLVIAAPTLSLSAVVAAQ